MTKLPPGDKALWDRYTQDVTPLGEPLPPQAPPPVVVIERSDPDRLDLHGLSVAEAHAATKNFLAKALANHKSIMVITGLSGEIKREFPFWFEKDPTIRRIEEMNGGGAYRIWFKRK